MIISLYRIIFGFLRVQFYGDLKERALTLCAQNGITLWGNELKDGKIECFISVREFKYLRALIRGKGVRVHIIKKYGLPFITNRYKKRVGILAGAVSFFLILQFMSGYIWIIDVDGNEKIKEKAVIDACRTIGITEGIKKNSIYPKLEREKLILQLDGVAWASINIEGCRLTVNITETKEKETEDEEYTNLLATADGIIEKMDIVSGTSVVSVGQAVKKGDLLVSGIVETTTGTRFVKSKGTVLARSQREIILEEDFKQKDLVPFGKVKTKTVVELFGLKIPLYLGSEKGIYKTEKTTQNLKLFSCRLPIKIHKNKFKFKREISLTYEKDQIIQNLENELKEKENIRVLSKEFIESEKSIKLKAVVEKKENIAESHKLIINAGN